MWGLSHNCKSGLHKVDTYPLLKVEELYTAISGSKVFTKLDMSQAYLQLPLDIGRKSLSRGARLSATHALCLQGVVCCAKR